MYIYLQRNLKVMISMGLSAKQEKDDRFQHIKKEVVEMIKLRTPLLESKVRIAESVFELLFFLAGERLFLCINN